MEKRVHYSTREKRIKHHLVFPASIKEYPEDWSWGGRVEMESGGRTKLKKQGISRSACNISGVDSQSNYAYARSLKRDLKYQCRTKEEQKIQFHIDFTSQSRPRLFYVQGSNRARAVPSQA
jgi:hypothetical protein